VRIPIKSDLLEIGIGTPADPARRLCQASATTAGQNRAGVSYSQSARCYRPMGLRHRATEFQNRVKRFSLCPMAWTPCVSRLLAPCAVSHRLFSDTHAHTS
jgi:hypothetical protein